MIMDKFEKQFENLDVQSQYMENAMGSSTTLTVPEDQVDSLMHQVSFFSPSFIFFPLLYFILFSI